MGVIMKNMGEVVRQIRVIGFTNMGEVRVQVIHQVGSQVGDQVWNQVRDQVRSQVNEKY
tara:strand:- start:87 stop:263 length:177 start_codon:yes stop_codon:yes gene_type:complete